MSQIFTEASSIFSKWLIFRKLDFLGSLTISVIQGNVFNKKAVLKLNVLYSILLIERKSAIKFNRATKKGFKYCYLIPYMVENRRTKNRGLSAILTNF